MATVNERLAALEAAIRTVQAQAGSPTQEPTTASAQDATQNARLKALETRASALEATDVSLTTTTTQATTDIADLETALADAIARIELLESTPGGPVTYTRALADSGGISADALAASANLTTYSEMILATSGLVAYWRLGEASGTVADNAEGTSALDGTIVGGPTMDVTGALTADDDGAITLVWDATAAPWLGDYITIPDNAALDWGDGNFSIELWFKRAGDHDGWFQGLWSKGDQGMIWFDFDQYPDYLTFGGTTIGAQARALTSLTDTNWHHVVGVHSTTAGPKIYLDGADVTDPASVGTGTFAANAYTAAIGAHVDNLGDYALSFSGTVDEVAVYNVALSAATIAAHAAQAGSGGEPPPGAYVVPGTIDATGATGVSTALQAWFDDVVPDGSTVSFPAGAIYQLDGNGLNLSSRTGLTLLGNGATLRRPAGGGGQWGYHSLIWMTRADSIVIDNFILQGNDPTPGVFGELEFQAAFWLVGSLNIEIRNCTGIANPGDFVTIEGEDDQATWCDGIWVHDCHSFSVGRCGIAIMAGRNILVEDCRFDVAGGSFFDIEPAHSNGGATDVTIRNNTCGSRSYVDPSIGIGFFFTADGTAADTDGERITVTGNVLTGSDLWVNVTEDDNRRQDITITNNVSQHTCLFGPYGSEGGWTGYAVMVLHNIDGLTLSGNVQPLGPGVTMYDISNCTDVTGP